MLLKYELTTVLMPLRFCYYANSVFYFIIQFKFFSRYVLKATVNMTLKYFYFETIKTFKHVVQWSTMFCVVWFIFCCLWLTKTLTKQILRVCLKLVFRTQQFLFI